MELMERDNANRKNKNENNASTIVNQLGTSGLNNVNNEIMRTSVEC